jgi:hypothetical protein
MLIEVTEQQTRIGSSNNHFFIPRHYGSLIEIVEFFQGRPETECARLSEIKALRSQAIVCPFSLRSFFWSSK